MMKTTGFWNDLRLALRSLLRQPGFTGVVVLTLGLGIGATTAVFTLLDRVLLRPLPFVASDRLLSLQHLGRDGQDELPISPGLYLLYRNQARTLGDVGMYRSTVANLVIGGEPERLTGQLVTPGFFALLGVAPARGRVFLEEEGRPGGARVVMLSDAFWKTRFGANPSIIGSTIDINGDHREVVGVMPARFGYPDQEARFWLPLVVDESNAPAGAFFANGIGRMEAGQTLTSVRAELDGMMARLPELVSADEAAFLKNVNLRTRITPLKQSLVGELSTTLWILFGSVGVVLLIACANVANLLMVRAEGRQRELAVRLALGAGRMQLLRAFLAESLVLAAAGAALGLLITSIAVRLTVSLLPARLPRMEEIGIDARVLGFTAVVAIGCAVFFGLLPLLRIAARDLAGQLREAGVRGGTAGPERHRVRHALVVSQVALALMLLIGSALMLRSFMALRAVNPGFDPNNVLTARLSLPPAEVREWQAVDQFFTQVRERVAAQPGVEAVGFVASIPLGTGTSYTSIVVEDHPRGPNDLPVFAEWTEAGNGYFEAMGIRLLKGRVFAADDGADGVRAVVVSEGFANKWWPNANPLGRRMRLGDESWYEIVGVVDNVRQRRLEEVSQELVYFPTVLGEGDDMEAARTLDIVIRTAGNPLAFEGTLRQVVRELNARIPIANPRAMTDAFASATARTSFTMALLGAASGIALLLGLVGIYGVISYVVSQRTREIGVRMALGASSSSVRRMIVRHGLILSGVGVTFGLIGSALLGRFLESLLYGVSATDPLTYLAVAVSLIAVASVACLIPAARAAAVDPSKALRAE